MSHFIAGFGSIVSRKRFFGAVAGTISGALLLTGCSSSAAPACGNAGAGGIADMEPVNLTISNIPPETSTSSIFLNDWMKAVGERSGGKITFDYYGGGTPASVHRGPLGA